MPGSGVSTIGRILWGVRGCGEISLDGSEVGGMGIVGSGHGGILLDKNGFGVIGVIVTGGGCGSAARQSMAIACVCAILSAAVWRGIVGHIGESTRSDGVSSNSVFCFAQFSILALYDCRCFFF